MSSLLQACLTWKGPEAGPECAAGFMYSLPPGMATAVGIEAVWERDVLASSLNMEVGQYDWQHTLTQHYSNRVIQEVIWGLILNTPSNRCIQKTFCIYGGRTQSIWPFQDTHIFKSNTFLRRGTNSLSMLCWITVTWKWDILSLFGLRLCHRIATNYFICSTIQPHSAHGTEGIYNLSKLQRRFLSQIISSSCNILITKTWAW